MTYALTTRDQWYTTPDVTRTMHDLAKRHEKDEHDFRNIINLAMPTPAESDGIECEWDGGDGTVLLTISNLKCGAAGAKQLELFLTNFGERLMKRTHGWNAAEVATVKYRTLEGE